MINKKTIRVIFLSLVAWIVVLQPSYSKGMDPSMHRNATVPDNCKKNAIPTLKCAPTTSAHFDQKGILWVAWYTSGHVYVSRSNDKGKTFNPPVTVNRTPELVYAKGENRPKLAFGNNNEIYV